MCFLLENTEKSLSQKEWEEKLLLVRVPVLGRQWGSRRARGNQLQSSPRLVLARASRAGQQHGLGLQGQVFTLAHPDHGGRDGHS